jgi:hypothetical protein
VARPIRALRIHPTTPFQGVPPIRFRAPRQCGGASRAIRLYDYGCASAWKSYKTIVIVHKLGNLNQRPKGAFLHNTALKEAFIEAQAIDIVLKGRVSPIPAAACRRLECY